MKMPSVLVLIIVGLFGIQSCLCFFDPITIGIGSAGVGLLTAGYQTYIKCRIYECCDDDYIPVDIRELQRSLASRLHGQHIVRKNIIGALRGYKDTKDPPKALVISFHGPQGTGKNFVSRMISEALYKKGTSSRYYHWFSGSTFSASRLDYYKELIKKTIIESLKECERSMFVFDEVDMMPMGLLDILSPFMDYGNPTFIEHESKIVSVVSNKSVFIFLSNRGSSEILEKMTRSRKDENSRYSMSMSDFDDLISKVAYNENGGFLNSNAIQSSLIDLYLPFLPLEEKHVKACMKDAFAYRSNATLTEDLENEIMSIVTYFDAPHNLYSKSGCKRIEQKVISTLGHIL